MIRVNGSITAETIYPCRVNVEFLANRDDGIAVLFNRPYKRPESVEKHVSPPAIVQLRHKEGEYGLFYLTYNEDFDIEKLPAYWQDSKLIWELKALEEK